MTRTVTPLASEDCPALARLLAADGLPAGDLDQPGRRFWRVADDHGVLGYGGLEVHGGDALLRSVVVPEERRGAGGGRAVVAAVSEEACRLGVERLWLLTTGADGFFGRIGFRKVQRAAAPADIRSGTQFAGLCPGSAVCMRRDLERAADAAGEHAGPAFPGSST